MTHLDPVRGKTEQRVTSVVEHMRSSRGRLVTYDELNKATGTTYDVLLYILTTLCEIGYVERIEVPEGPGRPRVQFRWINRSRRTSGQALGA